MRGDLLPDAVNIEERGLRVRESGSMDGKNPESWPTWATPRAEKTTTEKPETWSKRQKEGKVSQQPLPTQVQNWPTPDTQNHRDGTKRRKDSYGSHGVSLHHKIAETENWPTASARDWKDNGTTKPNSIGKTRGFSLGQKMVETSTRGKLNPSWVEQLMGLPVGWTQLPTEWIDSDCSATA